MPSFLVLYLPQLLVSLRLGGGSPFSRDLPSREYVLLVPLYLAQHLGRSPPMLLRRYLSLRDLLGLLPSPRGVDVAIIRPIL